MESVTIELRSRLRSCNVFVSLQEHTDPSRIQVKLNKDFITLRISKQTYNLCLSTIRIIPTSLSSLRVGAGWLSFRIQTTPVDSLFGSFGTELVSTSATKNGNSQKYCSSIELPPKETDLEISCTCCHNVLTKVMNLRKVLPLPTEDCEPGEWFCCSHNGDDYSILLEPGKSDYFYGPFYSVLNRDNFIAKLKIHSNAVVCNRCLAVIGVPYSADSLKIWNCCVEYDKCEEKKSSLRKHQANALKDFQIAVTSCYDDCPGERILLEASECGKTQYLLIKPMELNLDLLVAPKEAHHLNAIRLETKKVAKVLYEYGETEKTRRNDYSDAKHLRIALKSMLAGMEHLVASSKQIPPIYRNADEYHIGYVNFDDI